MPKSSLRLVEAAPRSFVSTQFRVVEKFQHIQDLPAKAYKMKTNPSA
jgi:hypothetical protein